MGFLFCPWLRWGRRHATSPNDTSCYQLTPLESLSPVEEQAEGVSWSADNDFTHEHKRRSSGLSDRLRRRFSKETNTGPKNADRKFRGSLLPFTHKPTNPSPGLIASSDFPSSLMSDRGYDSDAQFMDTPRKANNATENLYNNPSIWGSMSPLAQPYYETEPDEPGEEVAEESRIMVDGPFLGRNDMETSQLPWHPRDYPGWGVPPPITHSADYGRARKRVGSPYTTGFFDNPGRYSTFTNRGRRMGYPGRAPISPVPHASSVDSLYGPSSQLSIRKRRPPPPREPKSESHSVHLGEMDISKRLVSPSISPHVLSEKSSFDGRNGRDNMGARNVSHQFHDPTNLVTAQTPARDAHESDQVTSQAQVSSSYSRRTSFSSGFSKYHFETKIFNLPESVRESIKNPYAGASSLSPSFQSQETPVVSLNNLTTAGACDTTECAQQNKSPEQREVDPLVASTRADSQSNLSMALSSPRQVSVGWMSGGRRLGYGYTLVPADEDGGKLATGDTCSLKPCHLNSAATTSEGDTKASSSHVDKSCMGQNNKMILWKGEPIFEISNMMHRLNLRHWSGATTSSGGANNASEGTSNSSITSVLWGKLGYTRKSQNEPETHVDQKPPWSHFCGVGLDQALDGTQSLLKSSPTPTNGTEEQLSRGRAGLHRARSLWTKSRTITDRAHSLETKFTTKIPISIKQRSDLQQRKKTPVIRLKTRDRKKTINSLDEEKPILPISSQQDNPASPRIEEGQKSNLDHYSRRYGTLQETERNSSDTDLADAYEDCLEVCSIP
ncbi:uncharacterized protein BDW43DRAFT_305555 [Aspergillus alliaceus]|uniref:uncharacterized protein n=1 Tax=Petromyces alliaceus TaxID=209559 RepID=UPI0012A69E69|nr:uncharacterized protein BDW43DRAFT_305555 [Aspergillus alliaceus]KAB8239791.1 hypothetical protein BDW43DRAFT_305555 [Aspergillus alliaceus]